MSSLEKRFVAFRTADSGNLQVDPARQVPRVNVLLCTFNGVRFLAAQLASLERQSHANWRLIVSDDGSTDGTLRIVEQFAQRVRQPVEIRNGPRCGPAANFLSLANDPLVDGDYFAFCDQDDVWHPDKLLKALDRLRAIPPGTPAAYGGRTRLVDAGGKPLGHAPRFLKPPSFANALVQSIAGGNTMLLNRAAKRLFEKAGAVTVVSHDWWAYQLITGHGGVFYYDPQPQVDYRQHMHNCIGGNRGVRAQWRRFRMVLVGGFADWNALNIRALQHCRHLLSEEARAHLDAYEAMRSGGLLQRLRIFAGSHISRQTSLGNLAFLTAVLLKKV
jgi:glycosyltransferase involved in cell wall biosynthesis